MPTDKELFDKENKANVKVKKVGRTPVNREMGYQLLSVKPPIETRRLMAMLGCGRRMISVLKKEMKDKGLNVTSSIDVEKIEKGARNFDSECKEAMQLSFKTWLKGKMNKSAAGNIFNFCAKVWADVWDKPIMFFVMDRQRQEAAILAQRFLEFYGDDKQRIRRRKKHIRQFFTFMGREDINNRFLTMTRSRDPVEVRDVPEITFLDFPQKLDKAFNIVGELCGEEYKTALMVKLVSQQRTGSEKEGRELFGVRVKETNHSYLIMQSEDEFSFKVHAKANENWIISWIPKEVRRRLYKLYESRDRGARLFQIKPDELRTAWREACVKVGLPPLHLHDLRKVAITWFYIIGIPLELATSLNVGWRDLNTARDFYLQYRSAIRRDTREKYKAEIPLWFMEGLDQYLPI